jgi:hypothetical protein
MSDTLQLGQAWNGLTAISRVAHPQGWRPAAIFYPVGHPMPYAYDSICIFILEFLKKEAHNIVDSFERILGLQLGADGQV